MIRDYLPEDLPGLLDTWYQASRLAHPFLSTAFLKGERQTIEDVYMSLAQTWVYEGEGEVWGFLSLIGQEVGALFVQPAHQRQGIGRALMDHVVARHDSLDVEVFEANHVGRAFYAGYGFEPAGRRIHEAAGQPLLRLRLAG